MTGVLALPLAQSGSPVGGAGGGAASFVPVMIWAGVLTLAVVGGAVAIMLVRRSMLAQEKRAKASGASLESLRALRDAGTISGEEYARARDAMLGTAPRANKEARVTMRPFARSESGELIARPGFDLTGEPLPGSPDAPPQGPAGGGASAGDSS